VKPEGQRTEIGKKAVGRNPKKQNSALVFVTPQLVSFTLSGHVTAPPSARHGRNWNITIVTFT